MTGFATKEEAARVCEKLVTLLADDENIKEGCKGIDMSVTFEITDLDVSLNLAFNDGVVSGSVGEPNPDASVRLSMDSGVFDGMFTGEVDATSAAMSGELAFEGDVSNAMGMQGLMEDMARIYAAAKAPA